MVTVAEISSEAARSDDPARLGELARHTSKSVRISVAGNAAADDATVSLLLRDASDVVRHSAAGNLADRPALHALALSSDDTWVRAVLAHTFAQQDERSLPYEVQRTLAGDEFYETRGRIAETTDYSDLFDLLLEEDDPRVRGFCAANPRITLDQMERLVTDRSKVTRRGAVARGLRYPDDEQLVRLARDRSADVRWAVVFRPDRPRRALELIAEDTDAINRQHAESALIDNRHIMADQVVDHARDERDRAARVRPFRPPPRQGRRVGACFL